MIPSPTDQCGSSPERHHQHIDDEAHDQAEGEAEDGQWEDEPQTAIEATWVTDCQVLHREGLREGCEG